jgi:heme oxygenase (biliverdin-IX-beta and delta-forming)
VLVEGGPCVGLLPFVATPDLDALVVQAAGLARHSKGLFDAAPYEALIHAADTPGGDPLQVPRLLVRGRVLVLDQAADAYAVDARTYHERFPTAAVTAELPDFRFYRLRLESGRLVTGFARALSLSHDHFAGLARG